MKTSLEELSELENFILLDTFGFEFPVLFKEPVCKIEGFQPIDFLRDMEGLEEWIQRGYYVVGFANYEAIHEKSENELTYYFGVFEKFHSISFDNNNNYYDNINISNLKTNISNERYLKDLQLIKEEIVSGRVYQVNHTFKLNFNSNDDSIRIYLKIRDIFKTKYSSFIRLSKNREILSFSPELFYEKLNEKIVVQPMKGTGITNERASLMSIKNKAENWMIVDLLRNDLGRVSENGTVKILNLLKEEKYGSVVQLTSKIQSILKKEVNIKKLIEALFPSGSITGAPKKEAMKIIQKLEKEKRGIYTGMIGYIAPDSESKFSVAIRTIFREKNQYSLGIGGGIVYDSNPFNEWNEALLKATFIYKSMGLEIFESILFKNGIYYFLTEHLNRMENTSKILFGTFDRLLILKSLMDLKFIENSKVKISINYLHEIKINTTPIKKIKKGLIKVKDEKIESNNPLQVHKTSYRPVYDIDFSKKNINIMDIIYYDSENNITEGCISNIFICKDNIYYTPILNSQILPGIFRNKLIKKFPKIFKEKKITLSEMQEAKKIFICNSVRGITRVEIYDK